MKKSTIVIIVFIMIILLAIIGVGAWYIVKLQNDNQKMYEEQISKLENQVNSLTNEILQKNEENVINENVVSSQSATSNNYESLLVDKSKELVYSYVDETIKDTATEPSDVHIYQIPKLNINSNYANEVNSQIKNKYESVYNEDINSKKSGTSMVYNIRYRYFLNNNILSVVVTTILPNDGMDYAVYNINCATGEKATDNELLTSLGLNQTEYNKLLDKAKSNVIDKVVNSISPLGIFIEDNNLMVVVKQKSEVVDVPSKIIDLTNQSMVDEHDFFNF